MKVYLFIVTYNWCGESKRSKWVSPCVYPTEKDAKAAAYSSWSYGWHNINFTLNVLKYEYIRNNCGKCFCRIKPQLRPVNYL